MSSYPNMSYCMCENTLSALGQVMEAMREEGPMFLKELNRDEKRAYQELFNMCESFLTAAEELETMAEEEEYYDGQPDESQEWESFDPDC
jgi:hypothetical protein